ncbi:MAG: hydrogenase iron-sulfur subunit [Deltaproteobacteria bacterium]|nr:hydrogenase iron-sulfur subunit [Deltaproteobacteria bacterium]MBW2020092.1 hydrogenase iron-sulfur subunit [Deltaproteobacteria bacterium]MBW2074841.1 hydrogenase iron-sulfur subunit [Deltaproteobacteria bacterium]
MVDVGRHPNIELLTLCEVAEVKGYVGNFEVTLRKHPRYVTEDCTFCGECLERCNVFTEDEFNVNRALRKAIYTPFLQSVPRQYVIDDKVCIHFSEESCQKCMEDCKKHAIDFSQVVEEETVHVGAIIVATGIKPYDPTGLYGYGDNRFPDVITSMELERMMSPEGPTNGEIIQPSTGKTPSSVAFIQCVGSRSQKEGQLPYCSKLCCPNTVKNTLLLKERFPELDLYVFHNGIRNSGNRQERMFLEARKKGVVFVNTFPEITQGHVLIFSDPLLGLERLMKKQFDLVVLAVGILPTAVEMSELLGVPLGKRGFVKEDNQLSPTSTPTKGIYFAGAVGSPADIKQCIEQAGSAAMQVSKHFQRDTAELSPIIAKVDFEKCTGCGKCSNQCLFGAIRIEDKMAVITEAACRGCGNCVNSCKFGAISISNYSDEQLRAQLRAALREPEDKVIVFACHWCSYAGADFAGTSRLQYSPNTRIIKTMCSCRVTVDLIKYAFALGAPKVIVSGCHPGDCHYLDNNMFTKSRVMKFKEKLSSKGINPERLMLKWVSASEGQRFVEAVQKMEQLTVDEDEIEMTKMIFSEPNKRKTRKKVQKQIEKI